jgi:hypothetical protein
VLWKPKGSSLYSPNRAYVVYNFTAFEYAMDGRLLTKFDRSNRDHIDFAKALLKDFVSK